MSNASDAYEITNWPKRRRAIVELIDRKEIYGKQTNENIRKMAMMLERRCRENYHPLCAMIIRMRLIGVKLDMEDLRKSESEATRWTN